MRLKYFMFLVFCSGDSALTSERFMLGVDGQVVTNNLTSFPTVIGMLMAAFFNLNIKYPEEAAATLEFIQRYASPDR